MINGTSATGKKSTMILEDITTNFPFWKPVITHERLVGDFNNIIIICLFNEHLCKL